jgi:alanyl-tRNA synthetase
MGFERLVRVLQQKASNYDTDIFLPLIHFVEQATGVSYTGDYSGKSMTDIAMRVIADHVRAVSFGIADGEMPSNTGAGYVLRRIPRRCQQTNRGLD